MRYPDPESLRDAAWRALARGVDPGLLEVHTDSETAKMRALRESPRAALHVWVPKQKLQIRLAGTARLIHSDAARWKAVPQEARGVYGGTPAPGAPVRTPQAFTPEPAMMRATGSTDRS